MDRSLLLHTLVLIAASDGSLGDEETRRIQDVYERHIGTAIDAAAMLDALRDLTARGITLPSRLEGEQGLTEADATTLFEAACELAYADAKLRGNEQYVLDLVGSACGIDSDAQAEIRRRFRS